VPKVRKDSYWVPQKDLKPISDLQSTVAAWTTLWTTMST
jgi:hypothetical protein